MSIGRRLKGLREKSGWTQEQVAMKTGILRRNLSRHELDINEPKNKDLVIYAEFYNTTTDYILGINEESNLYSVLGFREQWNRKPE